MKKETPQQILQNAREEFEKRFAMPEFSGDSFVKHATPINDILSWHTSTLQVFIEAEIEHLEGMKIKISGIHDPWSIEVAHIESPKDYNQAIDAQIPHLKELLERLRR